MTGVQTSAVTVEQGTLSMTLTESSVDFGTLFPGHTTDPKAVGDIAYTNTLGDGLDWSASVAATDLVAGANKIRATQMTYTASTVTSGGGTEGSAPTRRIGTSGG